MKFIHLSDLHIGKRINEFSMIEDQQYIFKVILNIIKDEAPDAVMIAGDIYDRSFPPSDAVTELDDFIFKLSKEKFDTFIISGNHDSPERIAFGARIMAKNGIHLSPVYNGVVEPVTLTDELGEVNIYMLPFIKPFHIKNIFSEYKDENLSYTDAVRIAIEKMNVDITKRNIIISHQFVTGADKSGSEISVGGTDNVDCYVYNPFDYVALGHIHSSQKIAGMEHIRYCGTPLKYSFSEVKDKTITVVEMHEKGNLTVRELPLKPKRNMRIIEDTFEHIISESMNDPNSDDYICALLTDKYEIDNAMGKLRKVYPHIMELRYLKNEKARRSTSATAANVEMKTPLELFEEFYEKQTGNSLTDEEKIYLAKLIDTIEEEEDASN